VEKTASAQAASRRSPDICVRRRIEARASALPISVAAHPAITSEFAYRAVAQRRRQKLTFSIAFDNQRTRPGSQIMNVVALDEFSRRKSKDPAKATFRRIAWR
jgi:hypothetical protein